jgi:FdhD protein
MDLGAELGWPGYRDRSVQRWRGGEGAPVDDAVAEEAPVALLYNGEPHVVMLATPLDLDDFALGFSLTELIVAHSSEVEAIRVVQRAEGIEVRVKIPAGRFEAVQGQGRNLTGRTGCGLCGARTLAQAVRKPAPVTSELIVPEDALIKALHTIGASQRLNALTGAVHAAAWVVPGREDLVVREDVGRHNALDKLLGALARRGEDFSLGFVLVTSRASFEMVQKCAVMGVGLLAAMSAPTGLAIRLAEASGMTLVGFARDRDHVVYTHPQRLVHVTSVVAEA